MKKILLGLLFISLGALVWYLFLKKYDYEFHTTAKNTPGAVFSEISEWKKFTAPNSPDDIVILSREPFNNIIQKVRIDSTSFIEMNWDIEEVNDSVTALKVLVRSNRNELNNRWDIFNPFGSSTYIDTLKEKLTAFQYKLRNQKLSYKVKVEKGIVKSPEVECVCTFSSGIAVAGKAAEMVKRIDFLENYVLDRDLKLKGFPLVKITRWDRDQDVIDFDFCFPVTNTAGLDETQEVKIRSLNASPALKAVFNGNYRLSHIAWFDLLYRAEQRDLSTTGLPLEVFHNNPKTEEDPAGWKAEIYLPLLN